MWKKIVDNTANLNLEIMLEDFLGWLIVRLKINKVEQHNVCESCAYKRKTCSNC